MHDFSDHDYVMQELKKSQDADKDNRERARKAHDFLDRRDGQWEDDVLNATNNKPRYTFDLTTNLVNQISGKLKKADFAGDVKPMGGEATKDLAQTIDGIVRNIQTISNATNIYGSSGKGMITGGIDGWQVVQKFVDEDAFDQDLMIDNVENFVDRVWFDVGAEKQDRADADFGWKFTAFTPEKYKEKWPKGSGQSLDADKSTRNTYFFKPDLIMVGEFYYIEEKDRELVLMNNGAVYEDNEDFKKIKDELKVLGVLEERRRTRKNRICHMRLMDGNGWLEESEETVFDFVPLIPTYGNYKITDNKTIYHGVVEKRLDPQRVLNYALSRQIEEGALAPRSKLLMTALEMKGHTKTLATMNTNTDPIQEINIDPARGGQPIQQTLPPPPNPGLQVITDTAASLITASAGLFQANLGDGIANQSGVAIDSLKDQGDVGTIDYFESQEIAICHTMRILIKAIPKVYVGERQVRVLKEDGSFKMVTLNETILDEETQQEIVINDLSIGTYDVTCSAGKSFQNRQDETVAAMVEIGQVNPAIVQIGSDILLNNVSAPGMDILAERERARLFQQDVIPEEQWTDEEKEQVRQRQELAAQQPQQPSPEEMIGQAELIKAQNEQDKTQIDVEEKGIKLQLAQRKEDREDFKTQMQAQNDQFKQFMDQQQLQMDQNKDIIEEINTQAATLKLIREAMGLESIVGPHATEAFITQAAQLGESQLDNQ